MTEGEEGWNGIGHYLWGATTPVPAALACGASTALKSPLSTSRFSKDCFSIYSPDFSTLAAQSSVRCSQHCLRDEFTHWLLNGSVCGRRLGVALSFAALPPISIILGEKSKVTIKFNKIPNEH